MGLINFLILLVIVGLICGGIARLVMPGPDPMSIGQTIGVGVGGAILALIVSETLVGRGPGLLLSILFSIGIMYAIRRSRGGGLTDPGLPPEDRF